MLTETEMKLKVLAKKFKMELIKLMRINAVVKREKLILKLREEIKELLAKNVKVVESDPNSVTVQEEYVLQSTEQ